MGLMLGLGLTGQQVAGSFSPAALFGVSDTGWFYDHSDFSTLFQDSSGTTPVTAVGQPVGLQLDKSGKGNHRSQSTALSRPTLARHPLGGIRNLLTYTEQFDNAAWNKLATTITANVGSAPDNSTTADRAEATGANSVFYQTVTGLANNTNYTLSVYVKSSTAGASTSVAFYTNSGGTTVATQAFITTGDWQRIVLTANSGTLSGQTWFAIGGLNTFSTGEDLLVWGAQLELGSTATAYQKVVSAFDVTEAGQPDLYYLSYDGTSDSLATASFAWGTDKATVVAGVRKLSDAAFSMIAELSTADTNNGSLYVGVPTLGRYEFMSRGTVRRFATSASSSSTAPITNVIAALGDISGDLATLRVNGAQVAQSTADQGTGNYLTYPVYFGARAGTSLYFKGWEYSQFGINRFLTADELAAVESYTNGKTGAY